MDRDSLRLMTCEVVRTNAGYADDLRAIADTLRTRGDLELAAALERLAASMTRCADVLLVAAHVD